MKEKFRCSEFGNPNSSDACLQCPSNSECCEEQQKRSGLKQKAKTLKEGVVPWRLWIKSPAYLRLSPEKKIKSLLSIIERKEEENEK